jgi:hypothetical protein
LVWGVLLVNCGGQVLPLSQPAYESSELGLDSIDVRSSL